MSGLVLKLRPSERLLINGVVIENGDRRTRLHILTRDANVLRLRDAIHPEEATTPVSRVCYVAQLFLAGEADPDDAHSQLSSGIAQLANVFVDGEGRLLIDEAAEHLREGRVYQTMRTLRRLMPVERQLMAPG